MWLSSKVFDLFEVAKETVSSLREDLASVRAERDAIQAELIRAQIMNDWLRIQVNGLQLERSALLEKAYNIKLPTPEILRQPVLDPSHDPRNFNFDDMGDKLAKELGLPLYDNDLN